MKTNGSVIVSYTDNWHNLDPHFATQMKSWARQTALCSNRQSWRRSIEAKSSTPTSRNVSVSFIRRMTSSPTTSTNAVRTTQVCYSIAAQCSGCQGRQLSLSVIFISMFCFFLRFSILLCEGFSDLRLWPESSLGFNFITEALLVYYKSSVD